VSQQRSNSSQSPSRPTPVVTCFLLRFDDGEPRLLLVRRSQRVGSYQGRWAGVSGFVEKDTTPDEQAYTEIREETGLQREHAQTRRGDRARRRGDRATLVYSPVPFRGACS